jgi:hypothetical protein
MVMVRKRVLARERPRRKIATPKSRMATAVKPVMNASPLEA